MASTDFEQFRTNLTCLLQKDGMDDETIRNVIRALDIIAPEYSVTKISTDLIVPGSKWEPAMQAYLARMNICNS